MATRCLPRLSIMPSAPRAEGDFSAASVDEQVAYVRSPLRESVGSTGNS